MGRDDAVRAGYIMRIREAFGPDSATIDRVPFAQVSTETLRRKCEEIDRRAGHLGITDFAVPVRRRKPQPVFRPPIGQPRPNRSLGPIH